MATRTSPEEALATICETIGDRDRWPALLDLLRLVLKRDGKMIVEETLTVKDFAALTKCSDDIARLEFSRTPTFRVGNSRRMSWSVFRKYFLDKAA